MQEYLINYVDYIDFVVSMSRKVETDTSVNDLMKAFKKLVIHVP